MSLIKIWDRVVKASLYAAGFSFSAAAAVTIIDVVLRFSLARSIPAAIEISTLLVSLGAVLSMPACFSQRSNISVMLLRDISGRRMKIVIDILNAASALIFIALLTTVAINYAWGNWGSARTLPDTRLPYYAVLTVLAGAFVLSAIGAVRGLFWREPTEHIDG